MSDTHSIEGPDRDMRSSVFRGLQLKCPNCGKGPVLHSYLKVSDTCEVCQEDLSHARADDGPAYLTILIVCHVVGFVLHFVYSNYSPEPLGVALGVGALAVVGSLLLLPRMKGLIVAVQWAKRMHGFGGAPDLHKTK
ncbi:DUF983 domain-containing protein [Tateyamaria sp. SN3-11]|uniref:DUF983 domain-containing protein n=1 Tax=Tateyamaria sp. SN3-11 TaxID=3092147 RepID=UPI0039E7CCED